MTSVERYFKALRNTPWPGHGEGCHQYILKLANLGLYARIGTPELFQDIRNAIPTGGRQVSDQEIRDAIARAQQDYQPLERKRTYTPKPTPGIDGPAALARIIERAGHFEEVDLWDSSPIRLWDEPQRDASLFLQTMFDPSDLLFIGEREQPGIIGDTIRTAEALINTFEAERDIPSLILSNPLSGQPATTKSGKASLRADSSVRAFRHCIVEFDNISIGDQIKFWAAIPLPVKALVDSGNKSIHAWIDVSGWGITNHDEWQKTIRERLYVKTLIPLGVDRACANPSRLTRMPGSYRTKTARYQKILWLSSKGRKINGAITGRRDI